MQAANTKSGKRRSIRVQLKVPVTVSGADSSGFRFEFMGETVLVSKHGARIRTKQLPDVLCCGTGIRMVSPKLRESRTGRVVWLKGAECGVELQDPGNFWGLAFPPDSGRQSAAEKRPSNSLPALQEPVRAPSMDRPLPAKVSPQTRAPELNTSAERGGLIVLVTGISANLRYFQERTKLRVFDDYEGSVVMRQPVISGASLRLLVNGRTVKASVINVQRDAQLNRSFVRLRFGEALKQERWASQWAARRGMDDWRD